MDQQKTESKEDVYKIVICGDDPKLDVGRLYHWCLSYEETKSDLDVYFMVGRQHNYEVRSFWPHHIQMISDEIFIDNVVRSSCDIDAIADIRSCLFKILAYRTFGKCIVLDPMCHVKTKITQESIPVCDWGTVKQSDTFNKEGLNFFFDFEEQQYVEKIYNSVHIFNHDYSTQFLGLYEKYKLRFYDKPFYPRFCSAIMALTHKICNGTFLNDCWCIPYDENKLSIIQYHYTDEAYKMLIDSKFNVPIIKMLNRYVRNTDE